MAYNRLHEAIGRLSAERLLHGDTEDVEMIAKLKIRLINVGVLDLTDQYL